MKYATQIDQPLDTRFWKNETMFSIAMEMMNQVKIK